jgi:chemosensory pili system protein ChpC
LLGRIRWRGWQLPLIAFSRLSGIAEERAAWAARWSCSRRSAANAKAPYFALLTQGFPRLVTVSRNTLVPQDDGEALPTGVHARVMLNDDAALLPDLERVEHLIGEALATAA